MKSDGETHRMRQGKTLVILDEPRFVRALALVVDPADALGLLLEIGALRGEDLAIVRRAREALGPAYDRASDRKDWEQVHTIGVLQQALSTPDSAAYLAYCTRGLEPDGAANRFADALAVIGCAADTLGLSRGRPWNVEDSDLGLPHWREQLWRLLLDMPGDALPRPPGCACGDSGNSESLPGHQADRRPRALGGEAP